jgi:hypothetical protein
MVAAALLKMNYPSPLDATFGPSPLPPCRTPNPPAWDPATLAGAVAAHKADGERLHLEILDQERKQKEAAECAESNRHASLYRARQEEPSRKME